jgi:hypothetical protein
MNVLIDTNIAFRAFLRECIIFGIQQEVKSHVPAWWASCRAWSAASCNGAVTTLA